MRYAYSAVHGESRTVWACGDDGFPQALTFSDHDTARRVTCEANDADAYRAKHGRLPANMDSRAVELISLCAD